MLIIINCFLLTAALSFAGSLQPGPVNMTVLSATLKGGHKAGLYTAVGGSLPEMLYSLLAVLCGSIFLRILDSYPALHFISPALLLFTAFQLWFQQTNTMKNRVNKSGFRSGLLAGLANPLLIAFWWLVWMEYSGIFMPHVSVIIAFIIGSMTGAFLLLLLIVRLGSRYQQLLKPSIQQYVFRSLSIICLLLACIQTIRQLP